MAVDYRAIRRFAGENFALGRYYLIRKYKFFYVLI